MVDACAAARWLHTNCRNDRRYVIEQSRALTGEGRERGKRSVESRRRVRERHTRTRNRRRRMRERRMRGEMSMRA